MCSVEAVLACEMIVVVVVEVCCVMFVGRWRAFKLWKARSCAHVNLACLDSLSAVLHVTVNISNFKRCDFFPKCESFVIIRLKGAFISGIFPPSHGQSKAKLYPCSRRKRTRRVHLAAQTEPWQLPQVERHVSTAALKPMTGSRLPTHTTGANAQRSSHTMKSSNSG